MNAELQKLSKALDQIERQFPAGGKRHSAIVENPSEAGHMPFSKPSKKAVVTGRRLRRRQALLAAK
jgi:hypothetical protein